MPRSTTHADQFFVGNAVKAAKFNNRRGIPDTPIVQVDLGVVATASSTAHCLSQSVSSGVAALLNGASAGTNDVPRNVVLGWTNTAIATVTGLDENGETMVEQSASGVALTGVKAFKSITSITFNANVTSMTGGHGTVLGLPYRLGGKYDILAFYTDTTQEAATSTVVGDATTATATTGDVRGTISPATAPNASRRFRVWMKVYGLASNAEAYGVPQYAG
jgi:hypothetical protein